MTMKNQPFEDASPTKNDDFPAIAMIAFGGVILVVFRGFALQENFPRFKLPHVRYVMTYECEALP